jgi:hypothetical protein
MPSMTPNDGPTGIVEASARFAHASWSYGLIVGQSSVSAMRSRPDICEWLSAT